MLGYVDNLGFCFLGNKELLVSLCYLICQILFLVDLFDFRVGSALGSVDVEVWRDA